jgi:long-chain-fatty-acid--CoA ligase ACSBG
MGYMDMEDTTKESFTADGMYFISGDLGRRDERGFLHITGRIKEILITAGGENIPSVVIEDKVKRTLPIVSQCMLIGDGRKYLTLLITLKTNIDAETQTPLETLTQDVVQWCRHVGSHAKTVSEAMNEVRVTRAIQRAIDEVNKSATSRAQRIQKWAIIPQDFSISGGELGPTLKLRRHFVAKKYSEIIESMYNNDTAVDSAQATDFSATTCRSSAELSV